MTKENEEIDTLDPNKKYRDLWDTFGKKTYGRIWVAEDKYVKVVAAIIKELDEFEYSYLPEGFVAVYAGDLLDTIYGHKFEISQCLLTQTCWSRGIWITCVTGFRDSP